jgi:hypothetical protein
VGRVCPAWDFRAGFCASAPLRVDNIAHTELRKEIGWVYRFSDNLEFVTVRFRLFKQIGSGSLP